eukprot:2769287-Prymnesium_polylepis.1
MGQCILARRAFHVDGPQRGGMASQHGQVRAGLHSAASSTGCRWNEVAHTALCVGPTSMRTPAGLARLWASGRCVGGRVDSVRDAGSG